MLPSCFITGTDTDAGKTVVTSSLLRYLADRGVASAGLKPIASGFDMVGSRYQNADIESIKRASSVALPDELINLYAFQPAIAPHIAAMNESERLSIDAICGAVEQAKAQVDRVLVEGVGGWRVPLDWCDEACVPPCAAHSNTVATLAARLKLPVILVVGLKLGCLNHALLTAEAIIADGLELIGWVANDVEQGFSSKDENIRTLVQQIPAPLLFEVPYLGTSEALASYSPPEFKI